MARVLLGLQPARMAAADMTPFSQDRPDGSAAADDRLRPRPATDIDWPRWTRQLDRKRRGLGIVARWPGWVYRDATRATFLLEGIHVAETEVLRALQVPRPLRSRHAGRLRNHLAILRSLDRARRRRRPLDGDEVVRWYIAVSSGLSTASLSPASRERLNAVIRQIHSPQRRLQPAVVEAARLYADLRADPMFPGFNGILARLLLHAYLLNSGLPPVVFDAARDGGEVTLLTLMPRLLEMIDTTLDRLGSTDWASARRTDLV